MKNTNTMNEITKNETANTTENTAAALVIPETIDGILDALNAEKDVSNANQYMNALREAVKQENNAALRRAVSDFASSAAADLDGFWKMFLGNPYVTIQAVKQDKEGKWILADRRRSVLFSDIDKVYGEQNDGRTIARAVRYVGMISRFAYNLYANTGAEYSDGVNSGGKVTVKTYAAGQLKTEEYNFTGSSISKLQEQLNAIVKTILPETITVNMVKADVRYILDKVRRVGDGSVTVKDKDKFVMGAIFEAVRIRYAGKAYTVISQAAQAAARKAANDANKKAQKTANEFNSEKVEAEISKVPFRAGEKEILTGKKSA